MSVLSLRILHVPYLWQMIYRESPSRNGRGPCVGLLPQIKSPGTQTEAIQRRWRTGGEVTLGRRVRHHSFCLRTGPGGTKHGSKNSERNAVLCHQSKLRVVGGASRKGESYRGYRGSAIDSTYAPYAAKSLADYQARATFVLSRLQTAQLRLK